MTPSAIEVRRVYDPPATNGGYRILVDRLWPRGLSKAEAILDEWCRDIAPSTALRGWYGHRSERFGEFRRRYLMELEDPGRAEAFAHLRAMAAQDDLTLLTATKDLTLSHARVLAEQLAPDGDAQPPGG